eukprot:scaffold114340_cov66-Phaeocystis_antarctica.AAC.3
MHAGAVQGVRARLRQLRRAPRGTAPGRGRAAPLDAASAAGSAGPAAGHDRLTAYYLPTNSVLLGPAAGHDRLTAYCLLTYSVLLGPAAGHDGLLRELCRQGARGAAWHHAQEPLPGTTCYLLLATCYLPLTIYLLSTQYVVLTRPLPGCEGLLTSNYLLLTAHCLLLTTYYLLLTTYYLPGGDDGYVQGHRHPDANPRPHRHHLRHRRPRPTRTR